MSAPIMVDNGKYSVNVRSVELEFSENGIITNKLKNKIVSLPEAQSVIDAQDVALKSDNYQGYDKTWVYLVMDITNESTQKTETIRTRIRLDVGGRNDDVSIARYITRNFNAPEEPSQVQVKVNFANGDSLNTKFNGTADEAQKYYVGKTFNIGFDGDNLQKVVSIEIL